MEGMVYADICRHEKWIESIINSGGAADGESQSQSDQKPPRMSRVPHMLRDTKDFEKYYYEPRFVSIGPCHYGNEELQQGQKLKHRIAKKFIVSCDREQLEVLYKKFFEKIKEVKEFYDEKLTSKFKDWELAEMMLLDGCFILYYIKCVIGKEKKFQDLEMKSHVITFVGQDLFLLENQLPFFVLLVLITINSTTMEEQKEWIQNISEFIQKNDIMAPEPKELQLLKYDELIEGIRLPAHLLELLHRSMVNRQDPHIYFSHTRPKPRVRFTFRSLKELTAVGISLKPKIDKDQVTEISYDRPTSRINPCDRPTLKIPCITVDGSTRSKLSNLIAYEMSPDTQSDLVFTNYICFMESLIDNHEDVKKLRSAKILQNCVHSDDDVAKLFNEIGTNLASIPFVRQYEKIIEELQEDYVDKKMRYMAEFRAEYCKNPCTIFALIAAGILLILTAIQTYFQIWSSPNDCDALCKHIKMTHHL